jgi:hypothetical protein
MLATRVSSAHRSQPQMVVQGCQCRGLGDAAFGRPPKGEEIADIAVAWWAIVGLAYRDFDDGVDVSDPAFETWGREIQSMLQGK